MKLKFNDYTKICDIVNAMPVAAGEYVPPKEFSARYIEQGAADMVLFGVWLEETGVRTRDNENERRFLSKALKNNIEFTE